VVGTVHHGNTENTEETKKKSRRKTKKEAKRESRKKPKKESVNPMTVSRFSCYAFLSVFPW
jgi:hypothetical protein